MVMPKFQQFTKLMIKSEYHLLDQDFNGILLTGIKNSYTVFP